MAAEALTNLEILQSKSLAMLAQDEILRLILRGELEAGQKLVEAELAARLGVSRGPIREAFRGLEEAGLVQFAKNRGVYVREISADEAIELYEVRAGLDEMAGRLLAPRITDAEIGELQGLVDGMVASASQLDAATYFPRNIQFHDRIVEMTGNRKLLAIYRRVMNEMHLMRRHGIAHGGGILVSNDEHRAIVAALASRQAEAAGRAMCGHVAAGRDRLMVLLARRGVSDAVA